MDSKQTLLKFLPDRYSPAQARASDEGVEAELGKPLSKEGMKSGCWRGTVIKEALLVMSGRFLHVGSVSHERKMLFTDSRIDRVTKVKTRLVDEFLPFSSDLARCQLKSPVNTNRPAILVIRQRTQGQYIRNVSLG